MATRHIYRCTVCGERAPIAEGAVTTQSATPSMCRHGHAESWQVVPVAESTPEDRDLLERIRTAGAVRAAADADLRRLVVIAVAREIPVREVAAAAGVSPQTPLNWAKADGPDG